MKLIKLLTILTLSLAFTVIRLLIVWSDHLFVTGLNSFLGSLFLLLVLIIATLLSIKISSWLSNFLKNIIRLTPDVLFIIGFFSFLILDFYRAVLGGNSTFDIHLHDTYYVIQNVGVMIGLATIFGIFFAVYHWFPKIFRRQMNNKMGYVHFWITLIGAYVIFWPMHYEGLPGMPRAYLSYSGWSAYNQLEVLNRLIPNAGIVLVAAQLLFVFNFFYSAFKGSKMNT